MDPELCDSANVIEKMSREFDQVLYDLEIENKNLKKKLLQFTPPKINFKNLEHFIHFQMDLNEIGLILCHIIELRFEEFLNCGPFYYYKKMSFFKTVQRIFKNFIKKNFDDDYQEWCDYKLNEAFDKYIYIHDYINRNKDIPLGSFEENNISISLFEDIQTCFNCETCGCEINIHYNFFDPCNYVNPWTGDSSIKKLVCSKCVNFHQPNIEGITGLPIRDNKIISREKITIENTIQKAKEELKIEEDS